MTEDTMAQAMMTAQYGHELAAAAFAMFDAWREAQPEEVRDLDLLDQVRLYAEAVGNE